MGKNMLKLDTSAFEDYARKLENLNADLKDIFTDALQQAGETITDDTIEAMSDEYLPAGGQYRKEPSKTEASIVKNPKVVWHGMVGEIALGFDFDKPGAGGYLITGTPRMDPDKELNKIYKQKRYMNNIKKDMIDIFNDKIERRMGG